MKKVNIFKRIWHSITAHKVWSAIVIIAIIGGGYYWYTRAAAANVVPQYQLARVRNGNIIQTITGTGQVSAENQLDVTSKASGTITSIKASVGQHVHTGDLIATIDPTDALNSLKSAQLSYAKLVAPAKTTDLSNAQNSVTQAYGTAFNSISNTFIDLQTIIPGLNTLLYGQSTFLSDQQSTNLTTTGQTYRLGTGMKFDAANIQYQTVLQEYKALSHTSATSTIIQNLTDTYSLAKNVANTLQSAQNTITFITTSQPTYLTKDAATAQSEVITWSNSINGDVTSLLSAQNSIDSAENAMTNLVSGATSLDIQSQQLSLQQAEQTYANYFIRTPFDGVIGRIPVSVYGQAGSGTTIATIIGDQKIATLSLNEVDAAKVKAGDLVSITFNAINNFTATGTIAEIDLVGTVSSGVVSYNVKVSINTADSRIIPGMSVNAVITTNEIDNVLVVPSSAVKSQGNSNYVQIFDPSVVEQYLSSLATTNGIATSAQTGSSTRRSFASTTGQFGGGVFASSTMPGSTTAAFTGSTTRQFSGQGRNASLTISLATIPTNQTVTIGATDDTNTQITSGLSAGTWVVTKTIAGNAAKTTTAAPSLLSSLGAGGRGAGGFGGGGGGGAARTTTAAPAARPAGN